MNSFQAGTIQFIVKAFRRSLFVNRTETITHRNGFERISKMVKFPRHVNKQELMYEGVPSAWFTPTKSSDDKTILYLPGGGYCVGSYNTHSGLIGRIARASGHPVLGITYRKAPEDPFPAAIEDAIKVYKGLVNEGRKNIVIAGDSAGGGLALATTMILRDEGFKLPAALVLISPWTDLTSSGDSVVRKKDRDPLIGPELLEVFAKKYAGSEPLDHPFISPLYGSFNNFPPVLIQVGTEEVLLDDSTRLAKKMKLAGVIVEMEIWEGMMHVFQYMAGLSPEANEAVKKIGAYINRQYDAVEPTKKSKMHKEIY
ncbi:MAG: alpha/beta hydrolase [Chitinophagales bacterium]|nr:alpha/beta hydrolase [Chitinophagales bacterium]MCZ2394806.1 alpha/beta hydrolase [Chitinophagales bacterium]